MSVRVKILIPMVVMAIVCATTIGLLGVYVVNLFVGDFFDQQLDRAHSMAEEMLKQYGEDATRASSLAAEDGRLVESLQSYLLGGDRQAIVNASVSIMSSTAVDFLTVMDTEGNVIVRAHEPDNFGDSLANQANVKNAMQGKQYTTTEKGSAVKLSVRCGTPIFDENKNLIGVVSLGYRLDQNKAVDYVKRMTDTEVTVFLGDTSVSTTVAGENGDRAVGVQESEEISQTVLGGNDYIGRAPVAGKTLYLYYSPIRDVEGVVLGMLCVGIDTTATDSRIFMDTWIMIGVVLLLAVISYVVAMSISRKIARPIQEMAGTAKRLADGDINVEIAVEQVQGTKDEIVHLGQAFIEMIQANRERARVISEVAGGDLSGGIQPRSNQDVVGIALTELLEKNNLSFSQMNEAAAQLDIASSQIADGAQSLAESSSNQNVTIGHLHSMLQNLSDMTAEKVDKAKQAASLSESVKVYAEKGSHQMAQMMDAVEQISRASEAIGKVMKAIDDIAFQTNILALNAAVEAARAGQHGKGFAVVAEEVRNLAAKSADAAKETGSLIANSIEKAKLGAQISADTASSFADIVDGVNKSSIITEEIAEFIQAQNGDIHDVAKGVDEISSVVHAVSATAEQSAASSEEMSAQATAMASTLSGYRLRGGRSASSRTTSGMSMHP